VLGGDVVTVARCPKCDSDQRDTFAGRCEPRAHDEWHEPHWRGSGPHANRAVPDRALSRDVLREFDARTRDVECPECGRWERARALACRWCEYEPGEGRSLGNAVASRRNVYGACAVGVLVFAAAVAVLL
jgi:hypothetical protein